MGENSERFGRIYQCASLNGNYRMNAVSNNVKTRKYKRILAFLVLKEEVSYILSHCLV